MQPKLTGAGGCRFDLEIIAVHRSALVVNFSGQGVVTTGPVPS